MKFTITLPFHHRLQKLLFSNGYYYKKTDTFSNCTTRVQLTYEVLTPDACRHDMDLKLWKTLGVLSCSSILYLPFRLKRKKTPREVSADVVGYRFALQVGKEILEKSLIPFIALF